MMLFGFGIIPNATYAVSNVSASGTGPGAGAAGTSGDSIEKANPRDVVNDANDLIIPLGETYNFSGCHTYAHSVQIFGILDVDPWNGVDDSTGILVIHSPSMTIGATGAIVANGRGYGGGGGGMDDTLSMSGGYGGIDGDGGKGGQGQSNFYGAGGGGSNNGAGGDGGGYGCDGKSGNETGGGAGGTFWSVEAGEGGIGFGGGGGGGGSPPWSIPGGGGGGGGTGGENGLSGLGGNGSGLNPGINNAWDGNNGGYQALNGNGDMTTGTSVFMGSGGSGGSTGDYLVGNSGGGGGGGGAGGGAVSLISDGELSVCGTINTTGGGGGQGGLNGIRGGNGGGGAGGGVLLYGPSVSVSGTIDCRGRQFDNLSTQNGGTIKLFYDDNYYFTGSMNAGRIVIDGRPGTPELLSPINGTWIPSKPTYDWSQATDPDNDLVTYQLQVSTTSLFSPAEIAINATGISSPTYTPTNSLKGMLFYWRGRAWDSYIPGNWSEIWKCRLDVIPPWSQVAPLPGFSTSTSFPVQWSGRDDYSGVSNYTIYVSDNNSPNATWLNDTNATSGIFNGSEGHTYTFYSIATDVGGNRQPTPQPDTQTTVDTIPPTSWINPLPPYVTSTDFTVSWYGQDATSGVSSYIVYVSDNESDFTIWLENTTDATSQFTGSEGHRYTFMVRAVDNAGNIEPMPGTDKYQTIRVDGIPPVTQFQPGSPSYGLMLVYVSPETLLYLNSTDNCTGVNRTIYAIDNRVQNDYSGPFIEAQNGSHKMTYWSIDKAGNEEKHQSVWFFVDGEAPTTNLSFDGTTFVSGNQVFIGAQTRIILNGNDTGSGVNTTFYNIDGKGFIAYSGPFNLTGAGSHQLQYYSVDRLGQAELQKNITIVLDVSAPNTSATPDSIVSNKDIHINFSALDYESDIAATYFRVGRIGEPASDFLSGNNTTIFAFADHSKDGTYIIEYYSVDNGGNREDVKNLTVVIDTITNLTLYWKADLSMDQDHYTLTGKAEPGALVLINGKAAMVSAYGNFSFAITLNEGKNKIVVNATDSAGNTISDTRYIIYDIPSWTDSTSIFLVVLTAIMLAVAVGLILRSILRRKK